MSDVGFYKILAALAADGYHIYTRHGTDRLIVENHAGELSVARYLPSVFYQDNTISFCIGHGDLYRLDFLGVYNEAVDKCFLIPASLITFGREILYLGDVDLPDGVLKASDFLIPEGEDDA